MFQRFISEDPIGFIGSRPNFYAYGGDSPTNFVDPFGLIIGVIGDSQGISDVNQALQYLRRDPGMNQMINEMESSDTLYTIMTTHSLDTDYAVTSGPDRNISWNPHLGLRCTHSNGHEYVAILTPALALGHELAHQTHDYLAQFL